MSKQNYRNHIRYYTPHHFVLYPVLMIAIAACAINVLYDVERRGIWVALMAVFIIITWLAFMLRQHYAFVNQNRVVRLELRFRYYLLTHQRLEPLEQVLSFRQLAALRFASDEELPTLVQLAVDKNLSPEEIKKSIKNWLPDDMRV